MFNKRTKKEIPAPRLTFGYLIGPLLVHFLISFFVEFLLIMMIFTGSFMNYMFQNEEFAEKMYELSESEIVLTVDNMEEILSTDVVDEITILLFEAFDNNILLITAIASLVTIPVFLWYMRRDRRRSTMELLGQGEKQAAWKYIFIVIGSSSLCIALNNILTLSQVSELSSAYQTSSDQIYASSLWIQMIGAGILVPIAEEILFRGVIFNRLRMFMTGKKAICISALMFGVYHGNLVQFIYATICGLMLAWVYDKYGSLKAPITAHICMNITVLIASEYNVLSWIFESFIRMAIVTVGLATLAATMYVMINEKTGKEEVN